MKYLALILALSVTACSMDAGEVTEESKAKTFTCKDTRDSETFTFKGTTIRNARRHFDGSTSDICFDVTDTTGKDRNICGRMEMYLKCEEVK